MNNRLKKYSDNDLEVIKSRFKKYATIAKQGNAYKKIFFELRNEKPIFQDFSFVNEYWEDEILKGGDQPINDAIESVIQNIELELAKRKE